VQSIKRIFYIYQVQIANNYTQLIKQEAYRLGFSFIGISKAEFLEEEAPKLEEWLNNNYHGEMAYMANHFDKRLKPTLLVPGAKSVISLMYNYYTHLEQKDATAPQIAKYAYGRDYHKVVKKKLKELVNFIKENIGEVSGRAFVDSAPVMERQWAQKSGLGWLGKNTLLLSKKAGSYYFLGELILDLVLETDTPVTDHCGSCTKCLDACPTNAFVQPYVLDASKCISYLTIELKNEIPNEFKGKMDNWMFGCDICQQVCPWNRFATPHQEPDFEPHESLLKMRRKEWEEITEELFDTLFKGTPVKRTKYEGLKRNIDFLS